MGENYLFKYNVDMVFCIDATASMRPVINTVKNNEPNPERKLRTIGVIVSPAENTDK